MRILIPLDNRGGGGIRRVSAGLTRALPAQLGPEDVLLVQGPLDDPPSHPRLRRLPAPRSARNPVRRALQQQLALARSAGIADLVHMTDFRAPLLSSAPFVVTVHDVTYLDHPDWYPRAAATYKRRMLAAALAKRPAGIVCVSDFTLRRLLAHHPGLQRRCPLRVIHPGLESPPAAAEEPSPGDERGYFLTVSAIEPRKNHLGLLNAFQQARNQGLRLRWKVVGAVQYGGAAIADTLRAAPDVEVVGRATEPELEALYRAARFVALSSFEEGFGYPPLEAMARGLPALASSGSSIDEVAGAAALQVAPGDTEAWAAALLRLEGDADLRARLVDAGREHVRRFDWQSSARAHVELFREILCG